MKVLFLIQGFDTAASRYRVLQYLPQLEADGVDADVRPYPHGKLAAARLARRFGRYDVIFIQRHRLRGLSRFFGRRHARRIVFDFDDSIMYRNSLAPSPHSWTRTVTFRRMVRLCDHVIVGNSFLRDETRPHTGANVSVIPTPIDMASYVPRTHPETNPERIVIGWIGAHGSIHYLARLRDALDRMYDRDPRLVLKIVCDTFFSCERMPVIETPWSAETEMDDLRSFDMGIMPLLDDPWSRGKCGLKILQYLGAGVPVVCTPVGINSDIVRPGEEGLHASTDDDWVEAVVELAEDPVGRGRMGASGRRKVLESYSVAACYPAFKRALLGD